MTKILKRKLIISLALIIVGLIFVIYSFVKIDVISGSLKGYIIGVGGGFVTIGIINLIRVIRAIKNPSVAAELVNIDNDEMLIAFNNRVQATSFIISIILEALTIGVLMLLNKINYGLFLSSVLGIQIVLYFIIYLLTKRKY